MNSSFSSFTVTSIIILVVVILAYNVNTANPIAEKKGTVIENFSSFGFKWRWSAFKRGTSQRLSNYDEFGRS